MRHQVHRNDDIKSPADWDRMLDELEQSYTHHQEVQSRGHSTFIKDNGRHGGSPWAELMDAVKAMIDARPSPATPTPRPASPDEHCTDKVLMAARRLKDHNYANYRRPIPGVPGESFSSFDDIREVVECVLDVPPSPSTPETIACPGGGQLLSPPFDAPIPPDVAAELPRLKAECEAIVSGTADAPVLIYERAVPAATAAVELPDEPGFWYRPTSGLQVNVVVWRSGSLLHCCGESNRIDISCRCVDHLPRGGWAKAVPASDLAALREQLAIANSEANMQRDLVHAGRVALAAAQAELQAVERERDELRSALGRASSVLEG